MHGDYNGGPEHGVQLGFPMARDEVLPAGVYYDDTHHGAAALGFGISGIEYYDTAAPEHGETQFDFGKVVGGATQSPNAGLIVDVTCKQWSNDWHTQYYPGVALFALCGLPDIAAGAPVNTAPGMPGTTRSAVPATTAMTIFQVNYFLSHMRVEVQRQIGAERNLRAANVPFAPSGGRRARAAVASHIEEAMKLKEHEWLPPVAGATQGVPASVLEAYKRFPNLCWCNRNYISRHLSFLGIIKAALPSDRGNVVRVATTAIHNSEVLGYWPNANPFDYVGFVLTTTGRLFGDRFSQTGVAAETSVLVPWYSSYSKVARFADFPFRKTADPAAAALWSALPNNEYTYCIGRLIRNDEADWFSDPGSLAAADSTMSRDNRAYAFVGISPLTGELVRDIAADMSHNSPASQAISLCGFSVPH